MFGVFLNLYNAKILWSLLFLILAFWDSRMPLKGMDLFLELHSGTLDWRQKNPICCISPSLLFTWNLCGKHLLARHGGQVHLSTTARKGWIPTTIWGDQVKTLPFAKTQLPGLKKEGLVNFRNLQTFSVKGHTGNIFCFVGHSASATATQLDCTLCLLVSMSPARSQSKTFLMQSCARCLTHLAPLASKDFQQSSKLWLNKAESVVEKMKYSPWELCYPDSFK